MAYLFDDASSQRLARSTIDASSFSLWFYPDDLSIAATLYSERSTVGGRYWKVTIDGTVDDKLTLESYDGVSIGSVRSTGAANLNAWNHVYCARGTTSTTNAYISLNGETLVDGGLNSYVGGSKNNCFLGANGTGEYFSGMIAEFAAWGTAMNDIITAEYTKLALGFDPRLIPQDPSGTSGLAHQLQNYSPLIGKPHDYVTGTSWTVTSATVAADHPRIHRNLIE